MVQGIGQGHGSVSTLTVPHQAKGIGRGRLTIRRVGQILFRFPQQGHGGRDVTLSYNIGSICVDTRFPVTRVVW
eukprot:scaffold1717_cov169-Amphora_coffeaeformis.AAC.14